MLRKLNSSFSKAIIYTICVIVLLMCIYIGVSCLWIAITEYKVGQFFQVLSLCIKNAGSYSVLLVGIVITIFFQIYSKEKDLEAEQKIKIGEVGYYTLAFPREDSNYEEQFCGYKAVVEINDEKDYILQPNDKVACFPTKFLTSKEKSTNLKNIMAFSADYFEKNEESILKDYYGYCERVTYASPLYCSTKPTSELKNNNDEDINRYFWLFLRDTMEAKFKTFWISAVTEEGILLFIKVKVRIDKEKEKLGITLLQQTTYYKSNNKLCALYR